MEDVERNELTDRVNVPIVSAKGSHTQNGAVNSNYTNNVSKQEIYQDTTAPDGGTRAWLVMIGAFFCNGILFGVINSYGVLYTEILEGLKQANISEASSKAGKQIAYYK